MARPLPTISVVVPTVTGREALLARCLEAYGTRSAHPLHVRVIRDRPTCGLAWQEGAAKAEGDYIHLTADDLEPHEGWDVAAVAAIDAGFLPAPRVLGPDGDPQYLPAWGVEHRDGIEVDMSTIPFMSRWLWEKHINPLFTGHYWTDNFFTDRAKAAGFWPRLVLAYSFSHHWGQPGRGAGMSAEQRMEQDREAYHRATAMVAAGEWVAPWPTV